ncbi:hypothetical protein BRADI_1g70965v3 [Brachypodium distachyon]|uniref:Uncharacterized protein n=1 Tax=Brachypodium distachyon TaxID=15368 RepID=A0A2K2DUK1_BRADI|nr:hypothetical protein BRADI_1g70965v3 [Brachypodium distachyon]
MALSSSSSPPPRRSVFDAAYIRAEFDGAGISPHFIPLIGKYVLQNPRCGDLDGVPLLPTANKDTWDTIYLSSGPSMR